MTFSEYMKLYVKAEDAHALYGAWADGKASIGEFLKAVSEKKLASIRSAYRKRSSRYS